MSAFSDFFTKATPEEKEKVFMEVIKDSINDQRKVMNLPPLSPEDEFNNQ